MRLLLGLALFVTVSFGLEVERPQSRYDAPELITRELPPPPFQVEKTIKRDLQPGKFALTRTCLNTHAMIGSTITLHCDVHAVPPTSRILWYEFATSQHAQVISDNTNILPAHPNSARYRIVQSQPRSFHLEIRNVTLMDGGTYACADIHSGPPEVYIGECELVVLESNTQCTSQVTPSGVVLESQNFTESCRINFRGNMNPAMHWFGPEPYQRTDTILPTQTASSIAFTAHRSMDMKFYSLLTNFAARTNAPPGIATNPPSYTYTYTFQQMFVYWPPKNMFAVPMKLEYTVGESITCFADAFPSPYFNWENLATGERTNGQTFIVTENMVGKSVTLRCQAQNLIQSFLYSQRYDISAYVPAPVV